MEMKAIILRIAGYTDRKYLNCASELTNPGIASPLDFLLREIINSLYCSIYVLVVYFVTCSQKEVSLSRDEGKVRLYKTQYGNIEFPFFL